MSNDEERPRKSDQTELRYSRSILGLFSFSLPLAPVTSRLPARILFLSGRPGLDCRARTLIFLHRLAVSSSIAITCLSREKNVSPVYAFLLFFFFFLCFFFRHSVTQNWSMQRVGSLGEGAWVEAIRYTERSAARTRRRI